MGKEWERWEDDERGERGKKRPQEGKGKDGRRLMVGQNKNRWVFCVGVVFFVLFFIFYFCS